MKIIDWDRDYIEKVTATASGGGAWRNRRTTVTQCIIDNIQPEEAGKILDYGCGCYAAQVEHLFKAGYDIVGYDLCPLRGKKSQAYWDSVTKGTIVTDPGEEYTIVTLSNVVNIQESFWQVMRILEDCQLRLSASGIIIVNIPDEPKKLAIGNDELFQMLQIVGYECIKKVEQYGSNIWAASKKREDSRILSLCRP